MRTPADPRPRKKRKIKKLPEGLSQLSKSNLLENLKGRYETDPNEDDEVKVAHEVFWRHNGNTVDLTKLTFDQLRVFCRQVGVRLTNKCNKFQCRKELWILAQSQLQQQQDGQTVLENSDKTTNNIIRITNIIFSKNFLDSFLTLNVSKASRVVHETGQMSHDFWEDVAEAMNGSDNDDDDDDSSALKLVIDEEDEHCNEIKSIDLKDFDLMAPSAIKKKVNQLLTVRRVMKKNMATSGEHDNNPYNFVESAMNRMGIRGLSILGCYYFYTRCDSTPKVDDRFALEMDDQHPQMKVIGKREAFAAVVEISKAAKSIGLAMKESNRLTEQAQMISLAQTLGKTEILEKILISMASNSSWYVPSSSEDSC